ncbi:MAG: terminase [Terriglobales bacterium]
MPRFRALVWNRAVRWLLKIRDKHGNVVPLVANSAQAEFARNATGRDIVLKARQLGFTTWIAARYFILTVTHPGTVTVLVAHDQRAAEEIFRIVHRFVEYLPDRLRKGALATSRDNVGQIVFPHLDSEYRVATAADPNAGRGLTIHNLHCSEVARWPRDAAATLASLRAAVPRGGSIVLESTPNGAGGCFYDEWQRSAQTGYCRHFFPWWCEKEYTVDGPLGSARGRLRSLADGHHDFAGDQRLTTNDSPDLNDLSVEESSLIEKHHLSLGQIAYRREVRANFRGLARQEFAEDSVSCFIASGECVFDLDIVQRRLAECSSDGARSPASAARGAIECRDHGRLLIFWPPRPAASYIIGVDPAGGGCDGDYACAQVVDHLTGLQCAELHGHLPPRELAARVAALGREYNNALIAVERNNHGHAVLAHLDASEHYDGAKIYEQHHQLGWLTSAVSRPHMIEQFAALVSRHPDLLSSARLLTECRTFVRHQDGAAAAASGAHDDCVMAMAIAQAVRLEQGGRPRHETEVEFASLAR